VCRVFEDLIDDIRGGGTIYMIIEDLKDIVAKELDNQYTLQEKIFEAKNFTVYIATHRENKLAYNQLVLIKHFVTKSLPCIFGIRKLAPM